MADHGRAGRGDDGMGVSREPGRARPRLAGAGPKRQPAISDVRTWRRIKCRMSREPKTSRRRRQADGAPRPHPCQLSARVAHCRFEPFQWVAPRKAPFATPSRTQYELRIGRADAQSSVRSQFNTEHSSDSRVCTCFVRTRLVTVKRASAHPAQPRRFGPSRRGAGRESARQRENPIRKRRARRRRTLARENREFGIRNRAVKSSEQGR